DPHLGDAALVTGVRLADAPDGARSLRQASVSALDDDAAVQAAQALDAQDPEPGWPCYGGSGVAGARPLAAWSANTPAQRFPDGTGLRLAPGRPVVLQL